MKKLFCTSILLTLIVLTVSACAGTPTPDVDATAQAALAATESAQPTATPEPPTNTPTPVPPTDTPEPPTNTPTPVPPTNTPKPPTATPVPTDTPEPPTTTPTPAPKEPTSTPTPTGPTAEELFVKGLDYFDQEQWEEAITQFEEAIRLDPQFSRAYIFLGYSYASGPENFGKAVEALQKYLQLNPDDSERAEIEEDIAQLQRLATQPASAAGPDVPQGKALFVFTNYSGDTWVVDIGPYTLEVPPNVPPSENTVATQALEPGTYMWQAHSMNGGFYITDGNGNKGFEITLAEGDIYPISCCN
jgi:tetratricopeptide (TPR) repeat protein